MVRALRTLGRPLLLALCASGCHGARDGHSAPDAMVTATAAPVLAGPRSAEEAYWAQTKHVFGVPVGHSPVQGPAGALVTIVEFSEFQCASCATTDALLSALRARYGDKLRLVWKNAPLSLQPAAELAAEAALEVRREKGDGAFWALHDRFVDRRADLMNDKGPDLDVLVKIAEGAGGAPDKVRKAIRSRAHAREIDADRDLAEDFEVEAIPHLFVNGRRLEGVPPQARLEKMIDEEIARAEELLAKGTRPEALYETLVARGTRPWAPRSKPVVALPPDNPALGAPDAKVTVHVWNDYQCALCVAVERTMSDLRKEHGDAVRFVWHDLPLARHPDARLFARAAREAYRQKGAAGFWTMHDRISAAPQAPAAATLERFAIEGGLDVAKWRASLDGDAHASEIEADEKAAAAEGITETPTFLVVAGKATEGKLVGHIEYAAKLRRVVEMALDEEGAERERD